MTAEPGRLGELEVESFRGAPRSVVVRRVTSPLVVLGSSQPTTVVDHEACAARGVGVLRRRSGGGAVLLGVADPLWVDVWVPRGDPLWSDDVIVASANVGERWCAALGQLGLGRLSVHRGGLIDAPGADLSCFAGLGPGEVLVEGRKIVGLAQWRCRQGALFHCATYGHFDPGPLAHVLALGPERRRQLVASWGLHAVGLGDLGAASAGPEAPGLRLEHLVTSLLRQLPDAQTWRVRREVPLETV